MLQGAACPFCLQDLAASSIIEHYRAYFSAEYARLKRSVADTVATVSRASGATCLPPSSAPSV